MLKSNYSLSPRLHEVLISRIVSIQAHGVIVSFKQWTNGLLNNFEITHHVVLIEFIGFQYEFNTPRVTMRKVAIVRVL